MLRETRPASSSAARSLLDRALRLFSEVHAGEGRTVILMTSNLFLLLVGYYVLKTVREPLVLASAEQDLSVVRQLNLPSWLKDAIVSRSGPQLKATAAAMQAVLLIGFVRFYSWFASKVTRVRLIVVVTFSFVACIELFFVLRLLQVPMLGFFFYIWVGIFSVSMIAQFWSFGNDIYSKAEGDRLFPIIALGATAGSPVGSILAGDLFNVLSDRKPFGLDPAYVLMQIPAIILVAYSVLTLVISRLEGTRGSREQPQVLPGNDALVLVFQSPYVRLVALLILLLNIVNSTGEFILSEYVTNAAESATLSRHIEEGAFIGHFYGNYLFWVNVAALVLQAFVVSRMVKFLGLRGVLFALPIVALGSYGMFAAGVGLAAARWAKTAENATDYSIMNTGKALLWLPTTREEKYKAKQAVDTLFVRVGDFGAAVMFLIATAALSANMHALALVNMGLIVVWLVLTILVVRRHDQRATIQRER